MAVGHAFVERTATEASVAHSLVGSAMRACNESVKDCSALLGAAKKTHTAAKAWAGQVKNVSVGLPPSAEKMTAEVETIKLTSTFGGGGIMTWTDSVEGATTALAAAKAATEQLTTWAASATEGYTTAHSHVAALHAWLKSLYRNIGLVHDGAKAMATVDAGAAIEHLGNVAGWFQQMATEMAERQTAFEGHRTEAGQTLRSIPSSYGLLSVALESASATLSSAAENVRKVARDLWAVAAKQ